MAKRIIISKYTLVFLDKQESRKFNNLIKMDTNKLSLFVEDELLVNPEEVIKFGVIDDDFNSNIAEYVELTKNTNGYKNFKVTGTTNTSLFYSELLGFNCGVQQKNIMIDKEYLPTLEESICSLKAIITNYKMLLICQNQS